MDAKLDAASRTVSRTEPLDWDAAYRELLPKVYRYFCYKVGEGQLAEDLTATTFEKAWGRRRRYRHNLGGFSTWVFTIARNVGIDFFRTAKETAPTDTAQLSDEATLSAEAQIAAKDDFQHLAALLRTLGERERELLALRYGGGLTQREIADLTDLTPTNVGVILHRTVKHLREVWEDTDER